MKTKLNANAQAVLESVRLSTSHPTASEVYDTVKTARPGIGLASVYRILHTLVQQGYIQEIRHSDDTCRYDGHIERHDHAICTACGALLDVPVNITLPPDLLQAAADATGMDLSSHELRLYGVCPRCALVQQQ
ncbi:MAG TPA: transcriptional repressor [Dictyobacter sp.]|nr:transcriptional repressor [Dictyobacter sp.]